MCVTLCDVVCNNHSPAPIYGGYLPRTGVYCGACCAPGAVSACCTWHMCWLYVVLYVVLGAHLCVGYMYCGVLGAHLVQEGSGPCKIPNFSHLLWSYGTYMYFVRHVRIDPRQS